MTIDRKAETLEAGDHLAIHGGRSGPKFVKITRATTSDGVTSLNTDKAGLIRVPAGQLLTVRV